MVKHIQTIGRLLPTNYVSVFDHFVGLALKGLNYQIYLEPNRYMLLNRFSSRKSTKKNMGHYIL